MKIEPKFCMFISLCTISFLVGLEEGISKLLGIVLQQQKKN